jgi:hypothetical protein
MSKCLSGAGVVTILAALCMSWPVRDGAAQVNGATSDEELTVEQCINGNTDTSIDPAEEKELIRAGIIENKLDELITKEVCEEIIDRTPGGTPVERAIAADNVIHEREIVQRSMKAAVKGDVNGDGVVNAEDSKIASASSYAASQAAQKVIRAAIDEETGQIGVIEEVNAELVASYLQNAAQDQYNNGGGGGGGGNAGGGGGDAEDDLFQKVHYEQAQQKGEAAAQDKGASEKAAKAAGSCAGKLHLIGGLVTASIRGNWALDEPPKEMLWKDSETIRFRISPESYETIEQLKQQFEESEEPTVGCIGLTTQMKANLIGSEFDIEARHTAIQRMGHNLPTEWTWEFAASNEGRHELVLSLSRDLTPGQEEGFHDVIPVPLDTYINVRATPWQKAANFVNTNWQWLWTAILVPVAIWLWGRYRRSKERRDAGYV